MKKCFLLFALITLFTMGFKDVAAQSNYAISSTYGSMPLGASANFDFTNNGYFNYTFIIPTYPEVQGSGTAGVLLSDVSNGGEVLLDDWNEYSSTHIYSSSITISGSVYIGTDTRDCDLQFDYDIPNPYGEYDIASVFYTIEVYP